MNSPEESKNVVTNEEMPSGSRVVSDNNANTNNNPDQSKGAIPKTKIVVKNGVSSSKKSGKTNNNTENMAPLNCVVSGSSDIFKQNGYSKNGSVSNMFLNNTTILNDHETTNGVLVKESENFDYDLRTLNIPVEDDYLKLSYFSSNVSKDSGENTFPIDLYPTSINCYGEPNFSQQKNDSDSCSDDTELLSVSDDGCIYTYKAEYLADLPRSFFNLEIPLNENLEQPGDNKQGNSSPEMDFLEMDFDPEPSGDTDEPFHESDMDEENAPKVPSETKLSQSTEPQPCCSKDVNKTEPVVISDSLSSDSVQNNYDTFSEIVKQFYITKASVLSDKNEMPAMYSFSKKMQPQKHSETPLSFSTIEENKAQGWLRDSEVETEMIWTEQEAEAKQITQIAPSSCGATAVLNVLNALRIPLPTTDKIQELVNTRFRANSAPLAEYLMSRSKAGCNHRDLIQGLYNASEGTVYSRFFSMYPPRAINLCNWLSYWIKQGAVPVATLNLQKTEWNSIPDSWHHQMIYGVGPKGIYLTNPMDCVESEHLWKQLTSESVLLIRRKDVLSRFDYKIGISDLIKITDVRWKEMNVVGQVANLFRESRREVRLGSTVTSHIRIPAEYKSGITLAIDVNSPAFALLRQCPELPLVTDNVK